MKRLWIVALLAVLAAGVVRGRQSPGAQTSAGVQLEAAIKKEVVDGDLKTAIEMYRTLAQGSNRAVAAKALVRLGGCYERMGQADARQSYEQVLTRFADQAEAVADARARLAALGQPATAGSAAAPGARRLVVSESILDSDWRPTPDGFFFVYPDWNVADLAVFEVATGAKRRLTNSGKDWWLDKGPAISPDGRLVCYTVLASEEPLKWETPWEIRCIPFDGSQAPRTLHRSQDASFPESLQWFADGKRLLVVAVRSDKAIQLLDVNASDGSVRPIRTMPPGPATEGVGAGGGRRFVKSTFALSPDGRYLAYDRPQATGSADRDIFVTALETENELAVVGNPAHDFLVGWSPDGQRLAFGSDRRGRDDLWAIPIANGQPTGAPSLLRPDVGRIYPMLVSRSGSMYYGHNPASSVGLYVANINVAAGTVGSPSPVYDRSPGQKESPAWSPDGRWLAYSEFSDRPGGTPTLVIRGVASGQERRWPLAVSSGRPSMLQWTRDGKRILFVGVSVADSAGWFTVDSDTGSMAQFFRNCEKACHAAPRFLPDGRSIAYWRSEGAPGFDPKAATLVVADLATGREREIYRVAPGGPVMASRLEVSPDGLQLALWMKDSAPGQNGMALYVVPVAGGEPRLLYRSATVGSYYPDCTWTPDGQRLLLADGGTLRAIAVPGGEVRDLGLKMENLHLVQLRPDGRQIAFIGGDYAEELWVIDNLFTPSRPAR